MDIDAVVGMIMVKSHMKLRYGIINFVRILQEALQKHSSRTVSWCLFNTVVQGVGAMIMSEDMMRDTLVMKIASVPIRDPAIPAAAEPTGRLRVDHTPIVERSREDLEKKADDPRGSVAESGRGARRRDAATQADSSARRESGGGATSSSHEVSDGHVPPVVRDAAVVPVPEDGDLDEPPWRQHDLGAVLQQLNSIRPGIVRRARRRLHIRWHHCSAKRMKMLLTAAGVKTEIFEIVEEIVSTCSICRMWARPGPKSIASTSQSTRFNETVQYDLAFVKEHIILHMIDCCIRWSAGVSVPDKQATTLMNAMDKLWFRVFGSPQELIGDRESGVAVPESSARFLEVRGIQLTLRARGQHASLVERRNEILRQQLHRCDEQATDDGLRVDFEQLLSEAMFAKNSLFLLGGLTPYEALYGRTPPLLNVVDAERESRRFA